MNLTSWSEYLAGIRGSDLDKRVAERAGVSASSVSRWADGTQFPSPVQVITLARSYGESPVYALFAAGYLTQEEINREAGAPAAMQVRDFDDLTIAREIVRRIEEGESPTLERPVDDVVRSIDDARVRKGDEGSVAHAADTEKIQLRGEFDEELGDEV